MYLQWINSFGLLRTLKVWLYLSVAVCAWCYVQQWLPKQCRITLFLKRQFLYIWFSEYGIVPKYMQSGMRNSSYISLTDAALLLNFRHFVSLCITLFLQTLELKRFHSLFFFFLMCFFSHESSVRFTVVGIQSHNKEDVKSASGKLVPETSHPVSWTLCSKENLRLLQRGFPMSLCVWEK